LWGGAVTSGCSKSEHVDLSTAKGKRELEAFWNDVLEQEGLGVIEPGRDGEQAVESVENIDWNEVWNG